MPRGGRQKVGSMAFSLKNPFSKKGVEGDPLPDHHKMTPAEEAWDLAKTVLIAVGIALVLRIVLFQPFNIPSGSMRPTLQVGDFLIVSKPTFGYSRASLIYPFTRMGLHGRIFSSTPTRGEVIVFKNRKDGNKDYIKRVIGEPGDEIQMIGGRLYINGVAVEKESLGMKTVLCDHHMAQVPIYRETLPNGVSYIVQECYGDNGPLDNVGPYQVPQGHLFMMGDNRDQSQDSRVISMVGYVPFEDIVGKAEWFFFSVDGSKAHIWEVWKWPFAIRYGRIFDAVK